MVAKVSQVSKVKINLTSNTLHIAATGQVNTSGWTNPQLGAWAYLDSPEDGMQDFDFLADPPTGQVLKLPSPIAASFRGKAPEWLKGVRVHASSGHIEATVDDNDCIAEVCTLSGAVAGDDYMPWPW